MSGFWSPEAVSFLRSEGRNDLLAEGDARARRVNDLVQEARARLDQWAAEGGLYDGVGGRSLVGDLPGYEEFVGERLVEEVEALSRLLSVFQDLGR